MAGQGDAAKASELLGLAEASVDRVWALAAAKDAIYEGAGGMGDDSAWRVASAFAALVEGGYGSFDTRRTNALTALNYAIESRLGVLHGLGPGPDATLDPNAPS